MRATISFADLSADRPSLLVRFLAAIGPGTVLCKTSSLDIRHDGTSLEMLRARLPHYAFLPIPNAHYLPDDAAAIRATIADVEERGGGGHPDDREALDFLRGHDLHVAEALRDWAAQLDLGRYGTAEFVTRLQRIYQLPATGPLIVVGAPEDYLGYPRDGGDRPGEHVAPLHRLLLDSGYARRFRLVNALCDPQRPGLVDRDAPTTMRTITRREPGAAALADVGIIHLGRTPEGRTVLVVAGSTHPFGTLGGVRILCDHGRNPLQHLVAAYAAGARDTVVVDYEVRPQVPWPSVLALAPGLPIDADLTVHDADSTPSELTIREMEGRCAALRPAETVTRHRSLLADHLRARGPVSVVVKTYPNDRRDDATAKDLLESVIPGVQTIPVAENVPHHRAPRDDDRKLADGIELVCARRAIPDSPIARLAGFKGEWWERVIHWRTVLAKRQAGGEEFRRYVEGLSRLPASGPLILLGDPRSFLGADAPAGAEPPQLAALLGGIGHPNRFELLGVADDSSALFDHRAMRRISVACRGMADPDADVGLIHLTRGPDDRDILVIAGNNWLGTLAGVQLAFAERRPSIDRVVQDYVDGRRRWVDIGYRCRRVEAEASSGTTRFPMCHPSVDLEVELLDEQGLDDEFRRNRAADAAFAPLWQGLDSPGGTAPAALGDDVIGMRLAPGKGQATLSIDCRRVQGVKGEGDLTPQPIFASAPTMKLLDDFRAAVRQAQRSYGQDRTADKYRCYCFLVVGPPGSGKESLAYLLHQELGGRRSLEQANVAGLSDTLMQSQLFGHEKGAFTDAHTSRKGLFESVGDGGVCILDEFAAGPDSLQQQFQPQLLRFLQFGSARRLGSPMSFKQRVFVLASTNETQTLDGLAGLVRRGKVRADLVDRFAHQFELPPLRDRPLEILPTFLWMLFRARDGATVRPAGRLAARFERRALELLLTHGLPGNFRQLDQVATRVAFAHGDSGPFLVRTAMMEHALGLSSDPEAPAAGTARSLVDVELRWPPEQATKATTAPPALPPPPAPDAPEPTPRPTIAWPDCPPLVMRDLKAIDDPAELCRRLVLLGSDASGKLRIRSTSAAMLTSCSPASREMARQFDAGAAEDAAGALADAVMAGLEQAGFRVNRSSRYSVPFLAKWVLVALSAGPPSGQEHHHDPVRAEALRFPLPTTSWQAIWQHLSAGQHSVNRADDDIRLLRALTVLVMTGVDLRSDTDLRRIQAARAFKLQHEQSR